MVKISKNFIIMGFSVCLLLGVELLYMYSFHKNSLHVKQRFVSLSGLPDLALSNEAHFIRHRSYADTFSVFANSPELLEYFPSTYVYAKPSLENSSKISHE